MITPDEHNQMVKELRCENCKFKGESVDSCKQDEETLEPLPTGYFICNKMEIMDNNEPPEGNPLAFFQGGNHAALCVSSDFACNCWESKE